MLGILIGAEQRRIEGRQQGVGKSWSQIPS